MPPFNCSVRACLCACACACGETYRGVIESREERRYGVTHVGIQVAEVGLLEGLLKDDTTEQLQLLRLCDAVTAHALLACHAVPPDGRTQNLCSVRACESAMVYRRECSALSHARPARAPWDQSCAALSC
jgi:hypothetical protein